MKLLTFRSLILSCFLFASITVCAQTNLLLNSNADAKTKHWRAMNQATVEEFNGDTVFIVRNGGYFYQDIKIAEADIGKYALLIGRGSSERINVDGSITGLPYLYGYMLNSAGAGSDTIHAYLQGQKMSGDSQLKNSWVVMSGIFQVPPGTGRIRFFLNQAERRNVPHNGSAARFDNLGLYLFETPESAAEFVAAYK